MKKVVLSLTSLFMLLLASCGQQHDAEQLAEAFIEQNATAPKLITNRHFASLDSTKVLADSTVQALQKQGHELYHKDIVYPTQQAGRMLYTLRMTAIYEGDTLLQTFYLDEQMEHVVAFK